MVYLNSRARPLPQGENGTSWSERVGWGSSLWFTIAAIVFVVVWLSTYIFKK